MLNDYVFENSKYEKALRDFKATLFDIITIEEIKLSDIEMQLESEVDANKKEEIKKVCDLQDKCLKDTLRVTNELADSLIKLDSYSRNLRQLGSGVVEEAVAEIGNNSVSKAYERDIENAMASRDNLATNMINSVGELNTDDASKEQMIDDVQTIQAGQEEYGSMNTNYDAQEVVNDDEEDEQEVEDEEVNENGVDTEDDDEYEDESEDESSFEATDEDEEDDLAQEDEAEDEEVDEATDENVQSPEEAVQETSEVVLPSVDTPVESAPASENVAVEVAQTPEESVQAPSEIVLPSVDAPVESAPASENAAVEVAQTPEEPVQASSEVVLPSVDAPVESAPVSEAVQAETNNVESADTVDIQLPVINAVKEAEGTVDVTAKQPLEENATLDNLTSITDNQAQLAAENKELASKTDMGIIQRLKFIKSSSDVGRAILTSKNQVTKLRASRETQKALLSVRGSISSNPLAGNTTAAIDNALNNEETMEQQLVASGLLEASYTDKQKQIEAMLEQANALYKEGKAQEAQVMYDQISVLNKELQEASKAASK